MLSFFLFFMLLAPIAQAELPILDLRSTQDVYNVAPFTEFYIDRSHRLSFEKALVLQESGAFKPAGPVIDFGGMNATVWIHFTLRNAGATAQNWVLNTGSQRMHHAEIHVLRANGRQARILDDFQRPYRMRPVPYRLLVSNLSLAPGETASIFYRYRSAKSTFFPVKVMSPSYFKTQDRHQVFWVAIITGVILVFAVYSAFLFFSLEDVAVIYYIVFILFLVAYLLHQMGFMYAYVWPGHPVFNSRAAAFLAFTGNIFVLLYGRRFFASRAVGGFVGLAYRVLIGISATGAVLSLIAGNGISNILGTVGFLAVGTATALNLIVALRRYRTGDVSAGIAALGWSVAILWSIFLNGLSLNLFRVPEQVLFDNIYIYTALGTMLEAMLLTLALFVRVRQIIAANNRERADYIRLLEQEAAANKALAGALREKQAAMEDAARKGRLVEAMAHDIRQPLHAMRLSAQGAHSRKACITDEAINMIEDVLTTAFATATPEAQNADVDWQTVDLDRVLLPLALVFASPAREKRIDLRIMPCSLSVVSDRRMLVRIVNNLVSNALKNTENGQILVGCRRRRDGVLIQVIDTGSGIGDDYIEASPRQTQRATGRRPLGLAIVRSLCARIGARLSLRRGARRGTVAQVFVPLHPDKPDM